MLGLKIAGIHRYLHYLEGAVTALYREGWAMAKRVLIFDDDQDILDLYCLILEPEGYEVFPLPYAGECFQDIERIRPDLIIVDFLLHASDGGWKLLHDLHTCPTTSALPLILCSAAAEEIRKQKDYLQGLDIAIVYKPFDIDALLQVVREMLQLVSSEKNKAHPAGLEPATY